MMYKYKKNNQQKQTKPTFFNNKRLQTITQYWLLLQIVQKNSNQTKLNNTKKSATEIQAADLTMIYSDLYHLNGRIMKLKL